MHICPHEVMIVIMAIPLARYLMCLAIKVRQKWTNDRACPCNEREEC